MTIADRAVLVTGANRGIGEALVEEALRRGATRVYAGTRQPLAHADERVTPLSLDVTHAAQIQAAVERVESLDVLINNAGVDLHGDLSDRVLLGRHLAVNLFVTYGETQAFLQQLTRSRGAGVGGWESRRPLRPQGCPAHRAGCVRGRHRRRWACRQRRGARCDAGGDGRGRGAVLPRHLVDHRQPVHRAGRAGPGDRAVGGDDRTGVGLGPVTTGGEPRSVIGAARRTHAC
jgi:NAD(P)-dependent dehydrogenase (short-subunit alcohol dehydrogenase family)